MRKWEGHGGIGNTKMYERKRRRVDMRSYNMEIRKRVEVGI